MVVGCTASGEELGGERWEGWEGQEGGGRWGPRWEVGGGRREEGVREVRWEGFGSVWCSPRCCGSVRYGSGRFDTILGESVVESAMVVRCYETIKCRACATMDLRVLPSKQ